MNVTVDTPIISVNASVPDVNVGTGPVVVIPPNKEVFWATYGETTNEEIETAIQAGQVVLCTLDEYTHRLVFRSPTGNYHKFYALYQNVCMYVTCSSGSWSEGYIDLDPPRIAPPENPSNGDFLMYNGEAWVSSSLALYDGSVT